MTDEFRDDPRFPGVRIHESAYVDAPVSIGDGTSISRMFSLTLRSGRVAQSGKM